MAKKTSAGSSKGKVSPNRGFKGSAGKTSPCAPVAPTPTTMKPGKKGC